MAESALPESTPPTRGPVSGSVALMQPYFFPYPGYFALIAAAERFYTFDSAQYPRRGWVHRNRLLHPTAGWRYITLPVAKAPRSTPCDGVVLREAPGWQDALLALLEPYRAAPHHALVRELLAESIAGPVPDVAALCRRALVQTCALLGISTPIASSRTLQLGGPVDHPGDWGWRACQATGARRYLNPPGGRDLYRPAVFAQHGLQLGFVEVETVPYDQSGRPFEPHLSILDALAWLGRAGARQLVDTHRIDWPTPPAREAPTPGLG